MSFNIHESAPAITHLTVHSEYGKRLCLTENNINDVVNSPRGTTLIAFFKFCSEDDFAQALKYDKVSGYYTRNEVTKKFRRGKQGTIVKGYPWQSIRRSSKYDSECFLLRVLLHIVKHPTSFISLRIIQSVTYDIFQGACKATCLLEDDTHWESMLSEAAICCLPISLRYLFQIMISFCQITDPQLL